MVAPLDERIRRVLADGSRFGAAPGSPTRPPPPVLRVVDGASPANAEEAVVQESSSPGVAPDPSSLARPRPEVPPALRRRLDVLSQLQGLGTQPRPGRERHETGGHEPHAHAPHPHEPHAHEPHEKDAHEAQGSFEQGRLEGDTRPPRKALAPPATPSGSRRECERATAVGSCRQFDKQYDLDQLHGDVRLADVLDPPWSLPGEVAALPGGPLLDIDRVAFLDTETTGLAGGTGTVAFLVGVGWIERSPAPGSGDSDASRDADPSCIANAIGNANAIDNANASSSANAGGDNAPRGARLHVRQYLMRDYPEEGALLDAVREDLGARNLVTFNGRSFDWPLLEVRWRMNRRRCSDGPPRAHFDLLLAARRLWARTLHSRSLASLERHVLGLDRGDDMPGAHVPAAWFDWLETGDGRDIDRACRHNEMDILALVALLARVGQTLHDPAGSLRHPGDALGTARWLERRGRGLQARATLERGLADAVGPERNELRRALGKLCRRLGDPAAALTHWQQVLATTPRFDREAHEQVAKTYEHGLRNPARALEAAQRARALAPASSPASAALASRIERLQRRLARSALGRQSPPT